MELLTKALRQQLPPLYAQEHARDPIVCAKFFTPSSNWTWYVTEGSAQVDPEDPEGGEVDFLFFGFVIGFEKEWGYFSLKELESARGPFGLSIELDLYVTLGPLSEVLKRDGQQC